VRKMGLYDLEMISPWGCNFWMGGFVYNMFTKTIPGPGTDKTI